MNTTPTPPQTIDDLPAKCIAAWQALGVEFKESTIAGMERCWNENRMGVFTHSLRELVRAGAPVDRLPGWREALITLLNAHPEAMDRHGWFIVDAYIHLLDAADLLAIPAIAAMFGRETLPYMWMTNFAPRSPEERANLIRLIGENQDSVVQSVAFGLAVRGPHREEAEDSAARQQLIASALPSITVDALERFSDVNEDFGRLSSRQLVRYLTDADILITLAEKGARAVRRAALEQMQMSRIRKGADYAALNARLRTLIAEHPRDVAATGFYAPDPALADLLWSSDARPKVREAAVHWLMRLFGEDELGPVGPDHPAVPVLRRWLAEQPETIRQWFWNDESDYRPGADIYLPMLELLWSLGDPTLTPWFVNWIGQCLESEPDWLGDDEYIDEDEDPGRAARLRDRLAVVARAALATTPAQLSTLKPVWVAALCRFVDEPALLDTLSPLLMDVAAKSKPVQRALPAVLAGHALAQVDGLGWLTDKRKGVRDVGLEALLLSTDAQAQAVLKRQHDDKRTTDADRERIVSRLKALGAATASLPASAPVSLDDLIAKAGKAKIKPQVDKVWTEALAAFFAPLDPALARWTLNLAVEAKDEMLPQSAVTVLAQLSPERRAALAEHLLQLWLAENGDRKQRWMLLFVPVCGDDRLVEPLFDAFKNWHKRAKPKAVTALETLCALDTPYALSHVYEVYGKASYSYAIHDGAKKALLGAATRRGCDLAELADEMTPDFGLTGEGLTLDVGPFAYTVTVGTDLSLSITHGGTGKMTKTLPKAKTDEDADKRSAAESAIKLLKSGLKKVIKLQAVRLEDAMIGQRTWPSPRWRVLFVDHPVLGLIGQGLIWTRLDADGNPLGSFRISEDRSLIGADDAVVELAEPDAVRLWHPALALPGEAEAWTGHLADYEIKPFLDQVNRAVVDLTAEEAAATDFARFRGVKLEQFLVKRSLEGWNYEISDQDGSHIFGYQRRFTLAGVVATVETEDMSAFSYPGDTTTVGDISFRNAQGAVRLDQVPPTVLSTVVGHVGLLAAKAVGGQ